MGRAEERTNYILDRLAREGEVSVAQLASDLGVSPVTVRASLKVLDEQGYLVRTHGGARPTTFRNIHLRQNDRVDQKERIARAAADMIYDDDRIMIEAGTTCALIVKYLTGKRGVPSPSWGRTPSALSMTTTRALRSSERTASALIAA